MDVAIKVETEDGIVLCPKSEWLKLYPGDEVIIEGEKGEEIGKVLSHPGIPVTTQLRAKGVLRKIVRKVTKSDRERIKENEAKENEIFETCLEKIKEKSIPIKLIAVECSFDKSRTRVYFTAEERVDFRDLVKDIASLFSTRVEMRQISAREISKRIGGCGNCGRPLCCVTFIKEFEPTTVAMAKEQELSLDPDRISGPCGRILCCIGYEYEMYREMKKNLPPLGAMVTTGKGKGKVVSINPLRQMVTLDVGGGQKIDVSPQEPHFVRLNSSKQ